MHHMRFVANINNTCSFLASRNNKGGFLQFTQNIVVANSNTKSFRAFNVAQVSVNNDIFWTHFKV